jgi:DNA-binding NarL/FixJ family response regulator
MRVVIADDTMLTREGIVRVLAAGGVEVVGEAGDVDGLMRAVATQKPDCAVVDIRMPPTNTDEGIVAAQRIRELHPAVGVLVLSQHIEPGFAMRLLEDHPERSGYLLKDRVSDPALLVDALRRLTEGETVVDPTIVMRLLRRRRDEDPVEELSDREREVLGLVAEGLSNAAIGKRLFITERTVEAHVKQIFQTLGIGQAPDTNRRVLAVLAFLRSSRDRAPDQS